MFNDHVACVFRVKHLTRPAPQVLWCLRWKRRTSPALDLKRCSWCRTLMISAFFPTFFQSSFGNAGWCDDYGLYWYYTILYCTILYYAILHFIISYHAYHIISYHFVSYHIILYCVILHSFHYITLNYIYTSGFRRNQVYASWKLDKASIYIHLGQLRITFPSPFCVAGVGRSNITWF